MDLRDTIYICTRSRDNVHQYMAANGALGAGFPAITENLGKALTFETSAKALDAIMDIGFWQIQRVPRKSIFMARLKN